MTSLPRSACALALAATCALSAHAADATLSKIQSSGQLTIGYRSDEAPISYTAASGKPTGYAVEMCQQLAARLQSQLKLPALQLHYQPVTLAERFERIADGKIQLECAATTNTKDRRERVGFGLTYYYAGTRMLVRSNETREQPSQMSGARVAVLAGSTGQQMGHKFPGSTLVTVASTEEGAKAVAQGRADTFISDDIALILQAKASQGAVKVVGPRMSVEPMGPLVAKNAPDFQALVTQLMKDMYRDGTARQIYRKWFEQPLPAHDYALDLPPDRLLSDTFRRPDGFVTDWTVL
ncbi:MAG: amino acid ABC transporter substrate-binding protein [Comamonadaceae bacterium]|nr:amino acid ABC transporter substrate-binding protein [Comamonadaceae bacterium]